MGGGRGVGPKWREIAATLGSANESPAHFLRHEELRPRQRQCSSSRERRATAAVGANEGQRETEMRLIQFPPATPARLPPLDSNLVSSEAHLAGLCVCASSEERRTHRLLLPAATWAHYTPTTTTMLLRGRAPDELGGVSTRFAANPPERSLFAITRDGIFPPARLSPPLLIVATLEPLLSRDALLPFTRRTLCTEHDLDNKLSGM